MDLMVDSLQQKWERKNKTKPQINPGAMGQCNAPHAQGAAEGTAEPKEKGMRRTDKLHQTQWQLCSAHLAAAHVTEQALIHGSTFKAKNQMASPAHGAGGSSLPGEGRAALWGALNTHWSGWEGLSEPRLLSLCAGAAGALKRDCKWPEKQTPCHANAALQTVLKLWVSSFHESCP